MAAAQEYDEFKVARKRAAEQAQANVQQRTDAIARRFASLGNMNSGARIKQERIAQQEESQNLQKANEGIDAAEMAENRRLREREEDRTFASGEAEKARQFATSERLGTQGFTADQAAIARRIQQEQFGQSLGEQKAGRLQQADQFGQSLAEQRAGRLQQADQFDREADLRELQFEEDKERFIWQWNLQKEQVVEDRIRQDRQWDLQKEQLAESIRQFDETFGLEKQAQEFNIETARDAADDKPGGFINQVGRSPVGRALGAIFTVGASEIGKKDSRLNPKNWRI